MTPINRYQVVIGVRERGIAPSIHDVEDKVTGIEKLRELLHNSKVGTRGELIHEALSKVKIVYEGVHEIDYVKINKINNRRPK